MVTKRNSIPSGTISSTAKMKYRPMETGRPQTKGTKLAPSPVSVPEVLTNALVHLCKKILYVDPKLRVLAYVTILFLVSLVTDYMPMPKSYFSNTQNFFNQMFVKFSWAWTFLASGIFILLTSSVYCCGNRQHIGRHCLRLVVATVIWYVWTTLFVSIEFTTGTCLYLNPGTASDRIFSRDRRSCVKSGGKWTSFDISGHSFLLIWCVFFIIEESKPIIGWDSINDHIREEDYKRSKGSSTSEVSENCPETPLSCLTSEEFATLKQLYTRHTVWVKACLIFLTSLVLIWDLMLLMTAVYFHIMIEKILGGLIALVMWKLTYGWMYKFNSALGPCLPGQGKFKYSNFQFGTPSRNQPSAAITRANPGSKFKTKEGDEIPTFLGMPLWALRNKKDAEILPRNAVVQSAK